MSVNVDSTDQLPMFAGPVFFSIDCPVTGWLC